MKSQIKYIELKTGYNDDGPAWISKVDFSKSGKTIYFNDKAFKGNGHGTCFELETGDEYWISGIKKDGTDRHWAGTGKIMIDKNIVEDYLRLVNFKELDKNHFELVDILPTNKKRFTDIENEKFSNEFAFSEDLRFRNPVELSDNELDFIIKDLLEKEVSVKFNKARRSFKQLRKAFEDELEKRNKLEA